MNRKLELNFNTETVRSLLIYFALSGFLILTIFSCTDTAERGEGLLLGEIAGLDICSGQAGSSCPHYQFIGDVDNDLTPSCGTVSSVSTTTTTSSTTRAEDTDDGPFLVSSFYFFKNGTGPLSFNGATMSLQYLYNPDNKSFSMAPLDTCQTDDYLYCTDGGAYTCGIDPTTATSTDTTTTSIACDNTYLFKFTASAIPVAEQTDTVKIAFRGLSGTFNWEDGIVLDDNNSEVSSLTLDFNIIGSDQNSIFQGQVRCKSD